MKIALVIDCLKTGGAERQALITAGELTKLGHHTEIITYRQDREFEELIEDTKVAIVSIKADGFTRIDRIWKLSRHLRSRKFDVVHAYKGTATIFAALAARLAGIKSVFGGYRAEYVQGLVFRITHLCIDRLLSGWIVNSQTIADSMSAAVGIAPQRFFVVYNCINPATFISHLPPEDIKAHIGIAIGDKVVTHIARLSPEKNHYLFLDMAQALLRLRTDVTFLAVGDGPLRAMLQNRAQSLGIAHKVRFLGIRSDIPDILKATDVSVLTSIREGFPNSLIEAMCMGVPIVTTDYKAATELIQNGKQGFIVPQNEPHKMAEKINMILNDPQLHSRMGLLGQKMVEERFSPLVIGRTLISTYRCGIERARI